MIRGDLAHQIDDLEILKNTDTYASIGRTCGPSDRTRRRRVV